MTRPARSHLGCRARGRGDDVWRKRAIVRDVVVVNIHLLAKPDEDPAHGVDVTRAITLDPVAADRHVLAETQ